MKTYDIEYIEKSFRASNSDKDLLFLINFVKNLILPNEILSFTYSELLQFTKIASNNSNYYTFWVLKKNGKKRVIHAPYQRLKHLQKCINTILSINIKLSNFAHGYISKKDIKTNAERHVGQRYVFNADLKDFFSSITNNNLKESFIHLIKEDSNFSDKLSIFNLITDICCVKDKNKFILPHGSPTSPVLSNIVCKTLDFELNNLASTYFLNYTRYADDITFSGQNNIFQPQNEFYLKFLEIINKNNFSINLSKKRIQKFTDRQIVTGLVVNQKVNIPKKFIKDLRKWIHFLEVYGISKTQFLYLKQFNKTENKSILLILNGKLNYLKNIKGLGNDNYAKLKKRFDNILESHLVDFKLLNKNTYDIKTVYADSKIFSSNYYTYGKFLSHVEKNVPNSKKQIFQDIKKAVQDFKLDFIYNKEEALSKIVWKKDSPYMLEEATLKTDILLNRKHSNIIVGLYDEIPIITLQDNRSLCVKIPNNLKGNQKNIDLINNTIVNNEPLIDLVKSNRFTEDLYEALQNVTGEVKTKDLQGSSQIIINYLLKITDSYEDFKSKVTTQYETFNKINDDLSNITEVFNIYPVGYGINFEKGETVSKPLTELKSETTFKYDNEVHKGVTFTYKKDGEGNKYVTFNTNNRNLDKKLTETFNRLDDTFKDSITSHYGVVTSAINPNGELTFGFKPTKVNVTVLDILKQLETKDVYDDKQDTQFTDYDIITYLIKDKEYIPAKVVLNTRRFDDRKKIIATLFQTKKDGRWEIDKEKGVRGILGEVELEVGKIKDITNLVFHPVFEENGKKVVDRKLELTTSFIQPVNHQLLTDPYNKNLSLNNFNPSEVSVFKLNKFGNVYNTHYIANKPN